MTARQPAVVPLHFSLFCRKRIAEGTRRELSHPLCSQIIYKLINTSPDHFSLCVHILTPLKRMGGVWLAYLELRFFVEICVLLK